MSSNVREFTIGVRDYAKKGVPQAVGDVRDAIALEGLKGLVMLSPVDTGRLRGNWQTTVGEPAEGETGVLDPTGGATIEAGTVMISAAADPFVPVWLHNGLYYAAFVNNGTEKMPAVHMLEQTVARLRRILGQERKGAA